MLKTTKTIIPFILLIVLGACTKDMVNPYDRECSPNIWSPYRLEAEENLFEVKLNWKTKHDYFDGYIIEESADSSNWTRVNAELVNPTDEVYLDTVYFPGQLVYYRIFGEADKNHSDTAYSKPIRINPVLAAVQTLAPTDVSNVEAQIHGKLLDNGGDTNWQCGFFWSTTSNSPGLYDDVIKVDELPDGNFSTLLQGLVPGTKYHYRAFAQNSYGTAIDTVFSFTTHNIPEVVTYLPTNVDAFSADISGEIKNPGGVDIIEYGFYWSDTNDKPSINDSVIIVTDNHAVFDLSMTNLASQTSYYYRAFATNQYGTGVGEVQHTTTLQEPWKCSLVDVELVTIPAGTFQMGSESGSEYEKPVHQVSLDGFQISAHEITVCQFVEFLNAIECDYDGRSGGVLYCDIVDPHCPVDYDTETEYFYFKPAYYSADSDCPITEVTWYGANAYCNWKGGRLPTEAEWEYAARGGEDFIYSGSNDIDDVAWFSNVTVYSENTRAVKTKQANAFGLYDMSGNVHEWVSDYYAFDYYLNSSENNPQGPESGNAKVIRGGGYDSRPEKCSVFSRQAFEGHKSSSNVGFRIVFD